MKKIYSFRYVSLIIVFLNTIVYCASDARALCLPDTGIFSSPAWSSNPHPDSLSNVSSYKSTNEDCQAEYTWQAVENNPLAIRFVNNSTGLYYWVNWDFGDGQYSAVHDPVHFYSTSGIYEVCLSIGDLTKSCYDYVCKTVVVPIPTNCDAKFNYLIEDAEPFKVNFFGSAGLDADSLHWDFGDGSVDSQLNPFHIYADTGLYKVRFSAANRLDTLHCNSVIEQWIHIKGPDCISNFSYTINPYNPIEVAFETLPHGKVDFVYWDFGDGRNSYDPNAIHRFSDTGTYIVKHKIWNSAYPEYCTDSSFQIIKLNVVPCIADFNVTYDSLYPLKVQFQNSSAGSPNEFHWYFGDESSGDGQVIDHIYPTWGTYTACLIIDNNLYPGLCRDTICKEVVITPFICKAVIAYSQDTLKPLQVQFRSVGEGPADKYIWDFGDSGVSDEKNPFHVYADTGLYKVKLTVANSLFLNCCYSDTIIDLKLSFPKLPIADFSYYLDTLTASPRLYRFNDLSRGTNISSWKWNFGDGLTSTIKNPIHQFINKQNYLVCLEAIDSIPPRYTLKDRVCKEIEMRNYLDMGGSIYDSNLPINNPYPEGDTAKVILYRQFSVTNIQPVDTGYFSHLGYYWFRELLAGTYLIKGELTSTSHQALQFFATWAESDLTWSNSKKFQLVDNIYDADLFLVKKGSVLTGPGTIDGITLQVETPSATTGKTIGDVEVLLCEEDLTPITSTKSDITGHFYFYGLPLGRYKLLADKPGLLSTTELAVIDIQYPAAGNVVVKLYQPPVIGIENPMNEDDFLILPNPVNEAANVFLPASSGLLTLKVFNSAGLFTGLSTITREKEILLDLHSLPAGLYLLIIQNEEGVQLSRKFLKIEQ